jgi:hypothetical protein
VITRSVSTRTLPQPRHGPELVMPRLPLSLSDMPSIRVPTAAALMSIWRA